MRTDRGSFVPGGNLRPFEGRCSPNADIEQTLIHASFLNNKNGNLFGTSNFLGRTPVSGKPLA
jgi:hypothetical protein